MSTLAPLDIVNEFSRRAATAEDLTEIEDLVSADVDWFAVGDRNVVPWAGRWVGKSGVSQFYATLRRETVNERFDVRDVLAKGNRVVILGELATRVKRTGKLIECEFVFEFVVENGLITRFRPYEDSEAVAKACA
ncbi:nuclear transport factor 2 family protein [Mesorhizobium sp.]|uniref:nuclear transport factor 2 family protein n=1 Tax=Mesorhizobium sp. TaxID=1871066 RepID=UPI0025DD6E85|nr:nuclear transport factor 2 family protein [Mesorhizobium sp.]